MARRVSFSALESRSARLRLKIRRRPYSGPSLARGIALMYRRNKTNGTWVLKASNGHGAYWTKAFALADDFEDADAKSVLTFYQAQDQAKKLARGEDDNGVIGTEPITVDGALTAYETDLISRNANPYNSKWPRLHLTKALLYKPVAITTSTEWKNWRDSLLNEMARSTINRLIACVSAALEQAAQYDKRIKDKTWETGLAGLPNAQRARNIVLSDDTVRAFVVAAYEIDDMFGRIAGRHVHRLGVLIDRRIHPHRAATALPRVGILRQVGLFLGNVAVERVVALPTSSPPTSLPIP